MKLGATLGLSALLASLCVLGQPQIYSRLGLSAVMDLLRDGTSLNDADQERKIRGYYEELTHVERFDQRLAHAFGVAPDADWIRPGKAVRRRTGDFRDAELKPSLDTIAKGAPFRTNAWGIRDREYDPKPRAGTCRLALMGQSPSVGAGVGNDEIFEALLEARLNREQPLPHPYEILNFAQPAYTLLDQLVWIEKAPLFASEPAILLYVAHTNEAERVLDELGESVHDGEVPIPFANVRELVASAGLKKGADPSEVRSKLRPSAISIVRWGYQEIAAQCRQHRVRPVWIFLPLVPRRSGDAPPPEVRDALFAAARDAGFQIVDLGDVYQHRDQKQLGQAPWDDHPNTFAHGLIADELYQRLRESDERAPLGIFRPLDDAHAAPGGCK
jgi:hypothetical protein